MVLVSVNVREKKERKEKEKRKERPPHNTALIFHRLVDTSSPGLPRVSLIALSRKPCPRPQLLPTSPDLVDGDEHYEIESIINSVSFVPRSTISSTGLVILLLMTMAPASKLTPCF